jgi:hypothetical protein
MCIRPSSPGAFVPAKLVLPRKSLRYKSHQQVPLALARQLSLPLTCVRAPFHVSVSLVCGSKPGALVDGESLARKAHWYTGRLSRRFCDLGDFVEIFQNHVANVIHRPLGGISV